MTVKMLQAADMEQYWIDQFMMFTDGRKYLYITSENMKRAADFGLPVHEMLELANAYVTFEDSDGLTYAYSGGHITQVSGPCSNDPGNFVAYYDPDMLPHRVGGPAIIYSDGFECWYKHGKIHRIGGPAITYPDGSVEWYENDERVGAKCG